MPDIKLLIAKTFISKTSISNKYISSYTNLIKSQLAPPMKFPFFRKLCVTLMTAVLSDLTFPFSHFNSHSCILNSFKWRVNLQNPKHPTIHLSSGRTQVCTLSLSPYLWPYCVTPGMPHTLQDLSVIDFFFFKAPCKVCLTIIIGLTRACPVITLSLFLSVQPVLPGWVPTGIPSHQHQSLLSTGWET